MNHLLKLTRNFTPPHHSRGVEESKHAKDHRRLSVREEHEKEIILIKVNPNNVINKGDYKPLSSTQKQNKYSDISVKSIEKIRRMIEEEDILDLEALRKLAWRGVSNNLRPIVWKIFLHYVPLHRENREVAINQKRAEYAAFRKEHYDHIDINKLSKEEQLNYRVIKADISTTFKEYPLFQTTIIQDMLLRIFWVWTMNFPPKTYLPENSDLGGVIVAAFIREYLPNLNYDTFEVPEIFGEIMTKEVIEKLEADAYWCLCRILNELVDYHIYPLATEAESLTNLIKQIIKKIDRELAKHFEKNKVDISFFSPRWIYCLLLKEFPLRLGVKMFDTFIADEDGFSVLHTYMCVALLLKWSHQIKKMDFDETVEFMRNLPTKDWGEKDIEMLIEEAYMFKSLYEDTHGYFPN